MTRVFATPAALLDAVGTELGPTEWLTVDQDRIDGFAEVTGDDQWIHVDVERARTGPFGGTIAHGYLTLALVNWFLPRLMRVEQVSMGVNYGLERVRFPDYVPAGSRIRGRGQIVAAEAVHGRRAGHGAGDRRARGWWQARLRRRHRESLLQFLRFPHARSRHRRRGPDADRQGLSRRLQRHRGAGALRPRRRRRPWRRAGVDPARVEDVVLGCAAQQGTQGYNIGRLDRGRGGPAGHRAGHVDRPDVRLGADGDRDRREADPGRMA